MHMHRSDPTEPSLIETLWEWRALLLIAVVIALLVIGFRVAPVGFALSEVVAFGLPLVVIAASAWPLRAAPRWMLVAGAAVALAALAAAELMVTPAVIPPAPYAAATLSPAEADAALPVPDNVHQFHTRVHGQVVAAVGSGAYQLTLTRADAKKSLSGTLSRESHRGRRYRGSAPSQTLTVHESVVDDVDLPGAGAVHAHLASIDPSLRPALRVELMPAPRGASVAWSALLAFIGLAMIIEAAAARRLVSARLTIGVAIAAAFAFEMARDYNPDSAFNTTIGVALFALLTGALVGWLLGRIAVWIGRRRQPPDSPSGPAGSADSPITERHHKGRALEV
jgi:hypothetical protein